MATIFRLRLDDRRLVWLVAAVCSILYGIAAWLRSGAELQGDEPHYLILVVALVKYGSVDPSLVYANGDYVSFSPFPIDAHMIPTPSGALVPLHNAGAPLLWAPAYLVGGRAGVAVLLVVVATLIAVNIALLLRQLGVATVPALVTTVLVAAGTPLYVYSSMFFVEMVGALFVVYAVRQVLTPIAAGWRLVLASGAAGYLPFIHGRFALFTMSLAVLLAARTYLDYQWRSPAAYVRALLPLFVVFAVIEVVNFTAFDTLNPSPGNAALGDGLVQIPFHEGGLSLSFDRVYGLFPYFPLVVLALPGVLLAVRRGAAWTHVVLLGTAAPYAFAMSTFRTWWAGYSPPARLLCVLIPLLAFYVAVALTRLPRWLGMVPAVVAAAFSYGIFLALDLRPGDRFNAGINNGGLMLDRVGHRFGIESVGHYLPSLRLPGDDAGLFALWTLVVTALTVMLWLVGRRRTVTWSAAAGPILPGPARPTAEAVDSGVR